jgi:hypothetical protein
MVEAESESFFSCCGIVHVLFGIFCGLRTTCFKKQEKNTACLLKISAQQNFLVAKQQSVLVRQ